MSALRKVTPEMLKDFQRLRELGVSLKDIAAKWKVAISTVAYALNGERQAMPLKIDFLRDVIDRLDRIEGILKSIQPPFPSHKA